MNEGKQRIALAELDGWERHDCREKDGALSAVLWCKGSEKKLAHKLPVYWNDLNALREIEAQLDQDVLVNSYVPNLARVFLEGGGGTDKSLYAICILAGPEARAEALLRTFGKWEEEK